MGEYFAAVRECPRATSASQLLGCVIPEFGGAFRDSTGTLNIYLTDLASLPRAQRIVHYELERQKRPELPVKFIKGQYSFQQFNSIIQQLLAYSHEGIASVGIDEWINRLRIGYVTDDARARFENAIKALGIPREAIILEKGAYGQVL